MTTKKVILLSAATYFSLNATIWFLGWLIWPIIFLGLWVGMGFCGYKIEKKYGFYVKASDLLPFLIFGPIWFFCAAAERWRELEKDLTFLPKFRNPFVWAEKSE